MGSAANVSAAKKQQADRSGDSETPLGWRAELRSVWPERQTNGLIAAASPLVFSFAAYFLFLLAYRWRLAANPDLVSELVGAAVVAATPANVSWTPAMAAYHEWIASLYLHGALAVASVLASVYVLWERRQKLGEALLIAGVAYFVFLVVNGVQPEKNFFSTLCLAFGRNSELDKIFPMYWLVRVQAILTYPAASVSVVAVGFTLWAPKRWIEKDELRDLQSRATCLRLLQTVGTGMLLAATVATGLWYRWPAALVDGERGSWLRQIGASDTLVASCFYTASVDTSKPASCGQVKSGQLGVGTG